ncbi:MAG: WecB/TagA/CpsF family glycosyltransferase [Lachnospiraceae bacterium]|nr:WecB/TagA/CpsF family glycosyltransferase [Lachnospiraceae bacterium]
MDICPILGVNILVTNMDRTVSFVEENIHKMSGEYVCVSNGHTTVMSYEDKEYLNIQNNAVLDFPDGEPLSIVSRQRGFKEAQRVTGPDFMEQMFIRGNEGNELRHYFYGGSQDTLDTLANVLKEKYPNLQIAGMYSPPFRPLTEQEDQDVIKTINESNADIIWIGLGAPKQERWMYAHKGKLNGLMFGVGAGFDYHAGKLKRAPLWMQKMSLEWVVRLVQDPKRLWKRYLVTNVKFMWFVWRESKNAR